MLAVSLAKISTQEFRQARPHQPATPTAASVAYHLAYPMPTRNQEQVEVRVEPSASVTIGHLTVNNTHEQPGGGGARL